MSSAGFIVSVVIGVSSAAMWHYDNEETKKKLDYIETVGNKNFKFNGQVDNPGADIVFISQRSGGKPIHDIPKGNVMTEDGASVLTDELVWYVSPGAHITIRYDVSGEDFSRAGETIRTACVIGPADLTIYGTRKGKHVNVEWVSSKPVDEIKLVLQEELQKSLIMYAVGAGLLSSLACVSLI